MTNVEIRMTNEVRNPNDEIACREFLPSSFELRHSSFFRHADFVIVALCLLACGLIVAAIAGCNHGSTGIGNEQLLIAGVEVPKVDEPPSQLREQMIGLDPESTAFKEQQFKVLVAWDAIRRREGVDGFQQVVPAGKVAEPAVDHACVDQATGKVAFRALVCWNPTCPGRGKGGGPALFVKEWDTAKAGADGKVAWIPPRFAGTQEELTKFFIKCPHCGQAHGVAYYDPPEVVLRRRQLEEELRTARVARRQARDSGGQAPQDQRTPSQVMREINALPKLYLVPESGAQ